MKNKNAHILKRNSADEKRSIIKSSYSKISKLKKTSDFSQLGKNLIVGEDLKNKLQNKNKNKNEGNFETKHL